MECVRTATTFVLINSNPTWEFKWKEIYAKKIPCFLFSFLFGLTYNVLISHLQFSDVRALKVVLILFAEISSLKVNFQKNLLVGVNVYNSWLTEVVVVFNCKMGSLPFLYMGLPIGGDSRKLNCWHPLIDRIKTKLSGWKSTNLSLDGHLVLLKYVMSSLPIYFLFVLMAPSCIKWSWRLKEERGWLWYRVLVDGYCEEGEGLVMARG